MSNTTTSLFKKLAHGLLRMFVLVTGAVLVAYGLQLSNIIPCVPTSRIEVAGTKLWVCLADTELLQTRGLSHSRYLPRNWGMLFVFTNYSHHRFWMKDMNYPIDILWLDDDLVPREVARNAREDSFPALYVPVYANRFVLETKPGVVSGEYSEVKIVDN